MLRARTAADRSGRGVRGYQDEPIVLYSACPSACCNAARQGLEPGVWHVVSLEHWSGESMLDLSVAEHKALMNVDLFTDAVRIEFGPATMCNVKRKGISRASFKNLFVSYRTSWMSLCFYRMVCF